MKKEKTELLQIIKGSVVTLLSFLVTIIPFLYQQFKLNPEISRRYGVFPVNNNQAIFNAISGDWNKLHILTGVGIVLTILGIIFLRNKQQKINLFVFVAYFLFTITLGLYALASFSYFTGKAIQLYHFSNRTDLYVAYAFLFFCIIGISNITQFLADSSSKYKFVSQYKINHLIGLGVLMVALVLAYQAIELNAIQNRHARHARPDAAFPEWAALSEYRRDFNNLAKFLNEQKEDKQVLASFDHQVCAYWKTFNKKYTFNADLFTSTVTDAEAEHRLMLLCKSLGMNKQDFFDFIDRNYVNVFWFGLAKYQAHSGYTIAPLDTNNYSSEQISRIQGSSFTNTWQLIVPKKEKLRIENKFEQTKLEDLNKLRLDLLVITKDTSAHDFKINQQHFKKVYSDRLFDVWEHKKSISEKSQNQQKLHALKPE
ncbi:MAG: hypothetical protein H7Y04_08465 [Verrucomicrobia bacterium]|nr:hypothetical protein [Cytophagales bacterium]